jgi:hypothetical protein
MESEVLPLCYVPGHDSPARMVVVSIYIAPIDPITDSPESVFLMRTFVRSVKSTSIFHVQQL